MKCNCRATALDFCNWEPFQSAANVGERGFGKIPSEAGVYCLRAARVGEADPNKIIEKYRQSPLYKALESLGDSSDHFFASCGLGQGWGWKGYASDADLRLSRLLSIPFDTRGELACPILYIGCTKSLYRRMQDLMWLEHTVNHPLWALLYAEWTLELAFRLAQDHKQEECRLKQDYSETHGGSLPPLMDR
jgi:hypothetical protein